MATVVPSPAFEHVADAILSAWAIRLPRDRPNTTACGVEHPAVAIATSIVAPTRMNIGLRRVMHQMIRRIMPVPSALSGALHPPGVPWRYALQATRDTERFVSTW